MTDLDAKVRNNLVFTVLHSDLFTIFTPAFLKCVIQTTLVLQHFNILNLAPQYASSVAQKTQSEI